MPGITESFHKPRSGAGSSAERFLLFAARFSLLTPGLWSLYLQIEETRVNIDKISEHVEEAKRLYSVILSAPIPEPSECRARGSLALVTGGDSRCCGHTSSLPRHLCCFFSLKRFPSPSLFSTRCFYSVGRGQGAWKNAFKQ